ncbi:CPBP family glutamic-type intramembrane protease [Shewanella sp. GXUN23E]|uniref:CPBP family glutamic-type intramembrane protease n=1 Tax=Shewanella sp. GXUN23E TaxID=3422498 RepID=UPI003D7DDEE0
MSKKAIGKSEGSNMMEQRKAYWLKILILFGLGFVGVLSALPLIPQLLQISGQQSPLPLSLLYVISAVQSSALLIAMIFIGIWAAPKVELETPIIDAWIGKSLGSINYRRIILPAVIWGVVGGVAILAVQGVFLPYLPGEFIGNAQAFSLPVYTKLLYGGITEEILIRFGLMSFFTWGIYRLIQQGQGSVNAYNYILAIILSSLLFAIGHLPAVNLLSPTVTMPLVTYIILGNSLFGFIAGALYWKRGLEAAMIAHMVAHLVMIVGEKLV